jgi:hypothetical protein
VESRISFYEQNLDSYWIILYKSLPLHNVMNTNSSFCVYSAVSVAGSVWILESVSLLLNGWMSLGSTIPLLLLVALQAYHNMLIQHDPLSQRSSLQLSRMQVCTSTTTSVPTSTQRMALLSHVQSKHLHDAAWASTISLPLSVGILPSLYPQSTTIGQSSASNARMSPAITASINLPGLVRSRATRAAATHWREKMWKRKAPWRSS